MMSDGTTRHEYKAQAGSEKQAVRRSDSGAPIPDYAAGPTYEMLDDRGEAWVTLETEGVLLAGKVMKEVYRQKDSLIMAKMAHREAVSPRPRGRLSITKQATGSLCLQQVAPALGHCNIYFMLPHAYRYSVGIFRAA